ncbi:MAG: VWA domain-containing protein [Clostridia bacterium]|nr:VWA domain-containing protein [Clostridia bacterium]
MEDEDSETPTHETPNAANVPTAKTPASSPSPQIPLTKIDLLKKKVDITLEKKKLSGIVAKVALILDISGSMTSLYKKGTVQNVVERTAAVASRLDDDGVLDIWIYSQDFWRMPAVTENNYLGYVKREILDKKKSLGKIFSINNEPPVMEDVVKKYTKQEKSPFPVYLVFITDGGIYKDREIKKILISASKEPIFWQFVGIGKANYGILSELDTMGGRYVDNANFFALDDIDKISDDEIYDRLLNEFPMWIRDAKAKGILK